MTSPPLRGLQTFGLLFGRICLEPQKTAPVLSVMTDFEEKRGENGGRTAPVKGPENVILGGRVCFERAAVWEGQLGSCLLL